MKFNEILNEDQETPQWLEGYNAYYDGIHQCPYPEESEEYHHWMRGYNHARNED